MTTTPTPTPADRESAEGPKYAEHLTDDDHIGILRRAAEFMDFDASIIRTAIADGFEELESVLAWQQKQARTFRIAADRLQSEARVARYREALEAPFGDRPASLAKAGEAVWVVEWFHEGVLYYVKASRPSGRGLTPNFAEACDFGCREYAEQYHRLWMHGYPGSRVTDHEWMKR